MTIEKILFVDDEPNVLDGYRRQLGKKYTIECAVGGEEALALMPTQGPYAVVVSDMRMLGMDGVRFLSEVRKLTPDTIRMMLTGADHETAIQAVNEGNVFRFLCKPCPPELLELSLDAALVQYRLVTAERALLSSTLTGAVKILTDVLSAVRPVAFGRTDRVRDIVRRLAKELIPGQLWRAELAAMLSQMGCVSIPEDLLSKAYSGKRLDAGEASLYQEHPLSGHNLVKHVPRLEQVAEIILQQEKHFDGTGFPNDNVAGEQIPIEARILKVALDFDSLIQIGVSMSDALGEMSSRNGFYDRAVLEVLKRWVAREAVRSIMAVGVA